MSGVIAAVSTAAYAIGNAAAAAAAAVAGSSSIGAAVVGGAYSIGNAAGALIGGTAAAGGAAAAGGTALADVMPAGAVAGEAFSGAGLAGEVGTAGLTAGLTAGDVVTGAGLAGSAANAIDSVADIGASYGNGIADTGSSIINNAKSASGIDNSLLPSLAKSGASQAADKAASAGSKGIIASAANWANDNPFLAGGLLQVVGNTVKGGFTPNEADLMQQRRTYQLQDYARMVGNQSVGPMTVKSDLDNQTIQNIPGQGIIMNAKNKG